MNAPHVWYCYKEGNFFSVFSQFFDFCIFTQALPAGCCWERSLKELHLVLTLTCVVLSVLCTLSYHLSLKLLQVWSKMEKGAELMWKTGHCNQPLNSAREEKLEPPQGSSIQCVFICSRQFTHEICLLNVL